MATAADLIENGLHVRQAVATAGESLEVATNLDGVADAVQDGILNALSERGIAFDRPGHAVIHQENQEEASADMLRPAVAERHTMSAMLRVAAEASYEKLFLSGGERDCTRLLSAGGPNGGKSLVAPAGLAPTHFCDEEFTEILKWRLGIPPGDVAGAPLHCRNFAAKTGEVCEEELNQHCDHALNCSHGPLRIRRHEDVADSLADAVADTGAHVRREAYIKSFCTESHDAWLDVWAFGGLHLPELIIDVTIRHPMVQRYQPSASRQAGVAAAAAEKDKQQRYPPAAGRTVTAFAMETWGRLGLSGEELLQALAAEAARHARRHGQTATAGAFIRRWRATLDASLQRGVAAALTSSRCGLPGKTHRRWR